MGHSTKASAATVSVTLSASSPYLPLSSRRIHFHSPEEEKEEEEEEQEEQEKQEEEQEEEKKEK